MLGMRLCVLHNLYFYNHMMKEIRDAIEKGEYAAYKKNKLFGMQEFDGVNKGDYQGIDKNWRKG
jgi:queuine tRNA-ribosyltransferase